MKPSLVSTTPPVVSLIRCLNVIDQVYPSKELTWKEAVKFYKTGSIKLLQDLA